MSITNGDTGLATRTALNVVLDATNDTGPIFDSVISAPTGAFNIEPAIDEDIGLKTTGEGAIKIDSAWGLSLKPQSIGPDYGGPTIAISSGTYTSATGVISLTLASAHGKGAGESVKIESGVGTGISPRLDGYYATQAGTTGSTVVLTAPTGLGDGTYSGGDLRMPSVGGINYRQPVENMHVNILAFRNGGYMFEMDDTDWMMQVLPQGVNVGSPNTLTYTDTPKNTFEVGGGNPGRPNGYFANQVIGQDWARSVTAPASSLAVQGSIFVGGTSAPYLTATISSASYNSTTGVVTATISGAVGLTGYIPILISSASGTGDFARLNGTHITETGSSGTTLVFKVATGLTMTITGGTVRGRPAVALYSAGASYSSSFGAGGAAFAPTLPFEARNVTGGGPASSGTTQTSGIARLKSDSSAAALDIGVDGGNGAWLVVTNTGSLGVRVPLSLNDGGNVLIGTRTNGGSRLRVAGLVNYADNAAALAGGLTANDVYHTSGVLKVVI